jgi:[protein]-arginine 3-hydroxylase / protease
MVTVSLPMPRVRLPSSDEFSSFVERRVPVVIEGALDAWKAPSTWTFDRLQALVGDTTVLVQSRRTDRADDFDYKNVPFRSFVDAVRAGVGRDYLGSFPLLDHAPALWTDIEIPSYARPLSVSPRAFIGPRGSLSPLHFDLAHGLNAQIAGRKKVVVVAFRRRDLLRHSELRRPNWLIQPIDVEAPGASGKAGLTPVRRWETTLEPGDLLFLPSRRHHFLRSLEATISLGFFWHTAAMTALRRLLQVVGRTVH